MCQQWVRMNVEEGLSEGYASNISAMYPLPVCGFSLRSIRSTLSSCKATFLAASRAARIAAIVASQGTVSTRITQQTSYLFFHIIIYITRIILARI